MRALTLIQPWAHAVAHLGKRIENRGWKPPRWIIGERIAIHAGKTIDEDAVEHVEHITGRLIHELKVGCVVAVATVHGYHEDVSVLHEDHRKWWVGPYGWHLGDVHLLRKTVPCRGKQGLWHLPADIHDEVLRQIAWETKR